VRINADDHPDLSLSYDIQSVPTLLFILEGALRARIVGTASAKAILSIVQPLLGRDDRETSQRGGAQRN
jgi:thioredoxin-like negative regulator of GroEL